MHGIRFALLVYLILVPAIADPTPQPCDATLTDGDYAGQASRHMHYAEYPEAFAAYTCALQINPDNREAYYWRGLVAGNLGNYEQAIADYTHAYDIDHDAKTLMARADVYRTLKQYDLALSDYSTVIESDPAYSTGYIERGKTYEAMGDAAQAISDYSRAIDLEPANSEYHHYRAKVYLAQGDRESAIADYTQAIEVRPSDYLSYARRAEVYFAQGDYELAVADYSSVIEQTGNASLYYVKRGDVYFAQGDAAHARQDYQTALKLNPQDGNAFAGLGKLYDREGNSALALVYYRLGLYHASVLYEDIIDRAAALESEIGVECRITPVGSSVRIRSGPGQNFEWVYPLQSGEQMRVVAQTTGTDGAVWYWMENALWVRSDVVHESGDCEAITVVTPLT